MLFSSLLHVAAGCGRDLGWKTVKQTIRAQYPEVPQLSTDSLAAWLAAPEAPRPLLLDVREEAEYRVSHLPGAVHVPPGTDSLAFLQGHDPSTPIVTYCSVGYRSARLAERLRAAGYTNVSNLEGSIFAWANEGRPVYRGTRPVQEVHPYDRMWGRLLRRELHAETTDGAR